MEKTLRPTCLNDALLYKKTEGAIAFAGGTDLMVRHRGYTGTFPRFDRPVLFLDTVKEFQGCCQEDNELRIRAAMTLTQLLETPALPVLLRRSIEGIAAPGLRNLATLTGNVCNASPAGDSIPPLLVHNARFRLVSQQGERLVKAANFFTGPGTTVLTNDELLAEIQLPLLEDAVYYYRKVGTRKANALSKLSAAGYAKKNRNTISDFRFALGAVGPVVLRLTQAEELVMQGAPRKQILEAAGEVIRPIDDQRSTAAYRKQAALNALEEFLEQL